MEERLAASSLSRDDIAKHWLLNLAAEMPIGLARVVPNVAAQSLNTKPVPGCTAGDYARNLVELFEAGMVTLSSSLADDDATTRSGVSRILDRFLGLPKDYRRFRYLRQNDPTSLQIDREPANQATYELTAFGGENWERLAEPDWARFISGFTTPDDALSQENAEMTGELFSPDRDLLVAYMGWYPEVRGEQIRLETIRWDTHRDYEVLYWKRLPLVYRVLFRATFAEARWKFPPLKPQWFSDWWIHTCHWHREPWELPTWPTE
jgi:hypothetical protein